MTSETLKKMRIIVPGILMLLASLPLFQEEFNLANLVSSLSVFEGILYLVVISFLGGIYYLLNVRRPILERSEDRIRSNIKNQLLKPFQGDQAIAKSSEQLKRGDTLLDVFYKLIDNDESLKERARHVYLNGLFLSSLADIAAISVLFIVIYVVAYFILNRPHYLIVSLILCGAAIISFLLMPVTTRRHIELGDNQINYILVHYKKDLQTKLTELSS